MDTFAVQPDLLILQHFAETRDPDAFSQIVQRYGRVVYSASLRILGDQARAQDVAQETFFRLMRNPHLVTQSLGGWLHRSATRLALDARRSERARRDRERTYGEQQMQRDADESEWAELSPMVDHALADLPDPGKTLLIRHFLSGTPQADLAAEAGVSPATISRRIKAALSALEVRLKQDGTSFGMAPLLAFMLHIQAAPLPKAFAWEMGKMQLIATLRGAVAPPSPLATVQSPFPSNFGSQTSQIVKPLSAKAMAAYACILLLVVIYILSLMRSVSQSSPVPAKNLNRGDADTQSVIIRPV